MCETGVESAASKLQVSGFKIYDAKFRVSGSWLRGLESGTDRVEKAWASGSRFRVQGSGFRVQSLPFKVSGTRVHSSPLKV